MEKRGQVAIFVIVALLIVAIVIGVAFFRDSLPFVSTTDVDPVGFLKDCIEPEAREALEVLSKQGGYLNPEGFILHEGVEIKYLCYTSEFYKTCVVQQPLIKKHVETELEDILQPKAELCVNNLKQEYEDRNFDVNSGDVDIDVEIVQKRVEVGFLAPMTIVKGDERRSFEDFGVKIKSEMDSLLGIASTIVEFEAFYGDADPATFMLYYPNLRIEKNRLGDGTTIYKISDVVTKESFTFASRSLVWPPGYI